MDENVMTNEPALSTQVKNINTFLKGKGKVPCI
jgi:penicillin V acylase-like amidase (Ntn superfamily)